MAGSRPLSSNEERTLVRKTRKMNARDRALIITQAFTGFRISEVLSLTIGQVVKQGQIADKIGVRPAFLKGHYGNTRWVPVGPELRRALGSYLSRRMQMGECPPASPLFLSREHDSSGQPKALSRSSAEKIIGATPRSIADGNAELLTSHSLRKSWARRLYEQSGHDMLLVRDGLGHSSIAVTQMYLNESRDRLEETMRASDWSRESRRATPSFSEIRKGTSNPTVAAAPIEVPPPAVIAPEPRTVAFLSETMSLPGFESLAS